jgi:hypothetical protein
VQWRLLVMGDYPGKKHVVDTSFLDPFGSHVIPNLITTVEKLKNFIHFQDSHSGSHFDEQICISINLLEE